ncbi:DUF2213 domain-containing protein [Indiicoccus explosivorum]|uniref:DUF2213 domain-containing protein n=1 Tax=Indiicoccus explosivorum TaxID=1917864 RepID=UPI000B445DE8|nr:DUF2213 domain-containing protein [Indiicoccus explosivorum]
MKVQRYDKVMILDYQETSEGYLTVDTPITRPGVFPYQRQDGTIQMEAKLPDDVFSDLTIRSARSKAVTDGHPNEPVTLANHMQYAKGLSHTDSRVENGMLFVSLTVTDAGLIDKIRNGDQREISIGFLSDVVSEGGTYRGDQYEYVQRNIDINHIAIVEQGRAGPDVSIRNDSSAWQIETKNEGGSKMPTYKIDGKDYEVDPVVKARLDALEAQKDSAENKAKDYDKLQGRYDSLESDYNQAKADLEEAKKSNLSEDELDKKVQGRVELVSGAKAFLGDEFDFSGKKEREIKEAVIQKVKPDFKGDGKSDEYINAFYDATVERSKQDGFSSTGDNHLHTGDYKGDGNLEEKRKQRLNLRDSK